MKRLGLIVALGGLTGRTRMIEEFVLMRFRSLWFAVLFVVSGFAFLGIGSLGIGPLVSAQSDKAQSPAPIDRPRALAVAKRLVGGDPGALPELRALGPAVVPVIRAELVAGGKVDLLEKLIGQIAREHLELAVEKERTLIYYGQFEHLAALGEEAGAVFVRILRDEDLDRELRVRAGIALGDIRTVLSDAVRHRVQGELRAIAKDFLTEVWCVTEAKFLLARLGDRSLVEEPIARNQKIATQTPTAGNLPEIVGAHTELAEIFYRIQEYPAAIKHYQQKRVILVDLSARVREELRVGIAQETALLDYNLACSLSLAGRIDDCFSTLEQALIHETVTLGMVAADGDLRALRADPRFAAWFKRLEEKATPPE